MFLSSGTPQGGVTSPVRPSSTTAPTLVAHCLVLDATLLGIEIKTQNDGVNVDILESNHVTLFKRALMKVKGALAPP